MLFIINACGATRQDEGARNAAQESDSSAVNMDTGEQNTMEIENKEIMDIPESFVLIKGGTFEMGSPDTRLCN